MKQALFQKYSQHLRNLHTEQNKDEDKQLLDFLNTVSYYKKRGVLDGVDKRPPPLLLTLLLAAYTCTRATIKGWGGVED